jgi:NADPH:quinone reductase
MGKQMRAVLCRDFSGPDHLELGEAPEPQPAEDEILIDVHAASVTYMDYLLVSGGYQMRPPTPFVPGTEAAGVVVSVGSKVKRFKPDDRAACLNWIGGFGERMVAKEWKSVRIPDAVSFESAATVIHIYDTAYYALVLRAQLSAGETVVVTGAGGGVGMAAVDVARHLGGRVIAAVGSDRHAAALRERGVSEIVNYSTEKLRDRLKELTDGRGIDVCFDNVGGSMFEELARSMSWGGRLLPIGFTSGEVPKLPMNLPLLKNFSIIGVFAGAWEDKEPDAARLAKETLMEWVADGRIRPHVGLVLPLERIREAKAAIGGRTSSGRVVMKVK